MLKTYFIAQTQLLSDVTGQLTKPQILGVYRTLDEAKMALDAIGAGYGHVVEVRNPIRIGESIVGLPPRIHEWSFTPPKKARKKKAA